jgi:hypothetical protein
VLSIPICHAVATCWQDDPDRDAPGGAPVQDVMRIEIVVESRVASALIETPVVRRHGGMCLVSDATWVRHDADTTSD